jgi:hypothetical protein
LGYKFARPRAHGDVDVRAILAELAQPSREIEDARGDAGSQRQIASLAGLKIRKSLATLEKNTCASAAIIGEEFTSLGQADASAGSFYQRHAQRCFQSADLLCHSRLSEMKALGCPTDAASISDGQKTLEGWRKHADILRSYQK